VLGTGYVACVGEMRNIYKIFVGKRGRGGGGEETTWGWSVQVFQISRGRLKILYVRTVKGSKFYTEGPKILVVAVKNLVAMATWRPGFVHL
jgi:hypothetical protein